MSRELPLSDNFLQHWKIIKNEMDSVGPENWMNDKNNDREGGGYRTSENAAFNDILPELMKTIPGRTYADQIYTSLHQIHGPQIPGSQERKFMRWDAQSVMQNGMPSHFEGSRNERGSHKDLLFFLHDNQVFGDISVSDIAKKIYSPYVVAKGAGLTNIIVSKKELKDNHLEAKDLDINMKYFIMAGRKKGRVVFNRGEGFPEEYGNGKEALEKIQKVIADSYTDESTNMWPAIIRNSKGNGVQVVVMAGDRQNMSQAQIVGTWNVISTDKNGKEITKQLKYTEKEMWDIFKADKMGNFMDAENDSWEQGTLKERMGVYYNKYSSKENGGLGEVPTRANLPWWGVEVMDPGKLEWEQVIEPFWKLNKDLTPEEFAAEWEHMRETATYNWEDQWSVNISNGLVDPYAPRFLPSGGRRTEDFRTVENARIVDNIGKLISD
jgi:hypothetical protein